MGQIKSTELVFAQKESGILKLKTGKKITEFAETMKETVTEKRAAELIIANKELVFQNKEKEKRAAGLVIVNKILSFENVEKEKRAAELVIANKELSFQNEEKEKRAAELVIANKELLYEIGEKEKRAAELAIANKELLYQQEEKEKRAAELVIANIELVYENTEKKKRAAELVIANAELVLQNEQKAGQAEELAAANRELESFSYSVSHDLRAPLRAINGFTRVLAEDYIALFDEEGKSYLQEIIENSNKMTALIDNLLEFSRIGKQQVSMVNVLMKQLVDAVLLEATRLEPGKNIKINIKHLEDVKGDRNMLKQVFINLVSNAFKYTGKREQAVIEIGSYIEDSECVYYIKDNGAGFDMRYYDKLFGVFQRLHSSSEFDGTGVGLAIIQKIILKHQGRVWADGKVNEGACFYFSLPIHGASFIQ